MSFVDEHLAAVPGLIGFQHVIRRDFARHDDPVAALGLRDSRVQRTALQFRYDAVGVLGRGLLVCKVRVGSFGVEALPASSKNKHHGGTNKGRIGLIAVLPDFRDRVAEYLTQYETVLLCEKAPDPARPLWTRHPGDESVIACAAAFLSPR